MSLTYLGLLVLVGILLAGLIQLLTVESRLRKKLRKYDALDDKEGYQQRLESNIHLLERQQEDLKREIRNLQQQSKELDAKVYIQSIDYYERKYDFISFDEYLIQLKDIKSRQNNMVKNNQAYISEARWTLEDSETKGDRLKKNILKLLEISFEERCKYLVKEVKYNNIDSTKSKMTKVFDKYNKYLKEVKCRITKEYLQLKFVELDLQYELEDIKHQEQERDKEIRKQAKEREAIDKARKRAEEAEEREIIHQQELDKIRQEIVQAKEEEKKQLEERIQELERLVLEDRSDKENALSESRKFKLGYIYIISNLGSLGRDVYRICMTSRSQEDTYVTEMNPAVPFQFDVHFKIYSEDASDTLQKLHQRFDNKRVNIVNSRRDFFQVSIDEIETAIREIQKKSGVFLRIDKSEKSPQAYEYRQTIAARKKHRISNTNEEHSDVNEIA